MKHISALSFLFLYACSQIPNPALKHSPAVTEDEVLEHIKVLSDDRYEGRFPGSKGSSLAIKYIIQQFKTAGIEPAGKSGYFQKFDFITGISLGKDNYLNIEKTAYTNAVDYTPLAFSSEGEVAAPVVFAGYGLSINEDSLKWDDYSDVDAEGKWVLVFRGDPEPDNPHSAFSRHAALRKKIMVARDNGAAGILFVSPYQDQFEPDELIPLKVNHRFSNAGLPALQVTRAVADSLLLFVNASVKSVQEEIERSGQPHSFEIAQTISAKVDLIVSSVEVPNIIGIIPGNDPVLKNEYIVLGAHFDHLGYGGAGSGSLQPDTVAVHNGADDNASGVAGIIELGERLAANRTALKRSVLLMCYNAEEEGLLGSKYFTKNPLINLENIALMINLDMIGRYNEKLVIGGVGTSPNFETILNEFNRSHQLEVNFSTEGFGPSDHASFYIEDVPVLFFFTGTHEDYHKPSDDWNKINVKGEVDILNYIYDMALYLNQLDEKPVFTEAGPKEQDSPRRSFKVTFGIIPSYSSSVSGLEIDGVKKGGPAEAAGIQKGDIILAIDGGEIKDIYDYMYRLAELKAGQEVIVSVRRGEETLELKLQL